MNAFINWLNSVPAVQGAIVGTIGSLIVNNMINKNKNSKFSKQVKFVILESCRRVKLYVDTMLNEDKEEAQKNLESRIDGIKVIQNLLSEMQLNLIPSKDIGVVYRTREFIQEIINDLSIFDINRKNIIQFQENAKMLIDVKDEFNVLKKELHKFEVQLENDYTNLCKELKSHSEKLFHIKKDYNLLRKKIYQINK